jgi:hypothetical protein
MESSENIFNGGTSIRPFVTEDMTSEKREIRIIDGQYNEYFRVKDGGYILIDGNVYQLHYVDETHFSIGRKYWHICQFGECVIDKGAKVEKMPKIQEIIGLYDVRTDFTALRPIIHDDADGTKKEHCVHFITISAIDAKGKRKSHIFPLVSSIAEPCSSFSAQDVFLAVVARGRSASSGSFSDWQREAVLSFENDVPERLRFYLDLNCHDGLKALFDEQTLRELYDEEGQV